MESARMAYFCRLTWRLASRSLGKKDYEISELLVITEDKR